MKRKYSEIEINVMRQKAENEAREKAKNEAKSAAREDAKIRRQFRHDWAVSIVSALVGALISRPVWSGIDALIALLSQLLEQ